MDNIDLALVKKYNVAGPRYTSYPPATRFTSEVAWPTLVEEILENNTEDGDLSLYFHIPFCESLCWYCGCTTVITKDHAQGAVYLDFLEKELDRMAALLNPNRKVVQMHLGGGTPTFLKPDELRRLGDMIRSRFRVASDVEGGVEIDPRRLTRDHVAALQEAGFNRASLGVQDFDPKVQLAVHRVQSREQTGKAIEWLRSHRFESINIDLIYGLPYQTTETLAQTLDAVQAYRPDRLAVFSYAHVPWIKPAQRALEEALPSADEKFALLKQVIETLTTGDEYIYIGMDHFARPDDELAIAQRNKTLHRNFQGYSTRGGVDIYSFGMSAISQIGRAYWQNTKELPDYYERLNGKDFPFVRGYLLTDDDQIRRRIIMRLMCDLSVDFDSMSQETGIDLHRYFAEEIRSLDELEADGLLLRTSSGFEITAMGRLFLRNVAMRFDACSNRETGRMFSRTI